jgi:poly(3-hydroxybutyrate) depolymerase
MNLRWGAQWTARAVTPATALAAVLAAAAAPAAATPATGLQQDVVFTDYSPLSASTELVRRLLSPLAAAQVQSMLARSTERLIEQSIDLSAERFVLYVPAAAPPAGYGLLVFVPPWQEARLPAGWEAVLDRYGIIYVSAARSGNDENVMGRREPLALLAAYNVMQRYPIDKERVYVGGFSGGSRIALRVALGFPELFRGALLNGGSDPLGSGVPPLPPPQLFQRFQESTRLVYLTGEHDSERLAMDAASLQSMRRWCVFDVDSEITPGAGHEVAVPAALSQALYALRTHSRPDPGRLAKCRADIEQDLLAELGKAQSLVAAGKRSDAQKLLIAIDRRFGGLAAPRSSELQSVLNCAGQCAAAGGQ